MSSMGKPALGVINKNRLASGRKPAPISPMPRPDMVRKQPATFRWGGGGMPPVPSNWIKK